MYNKNFISEYLTDKDLDEISAAIGEIEKRTSGELRLCIKKNRGYLESDLSPRELAIREFFNLKMNETADKTGVLFYVLFDEHKFEIVADEGINSKISQSEWNNISSEMIKEFSSHRYKDGFLKSLLKVGDILIREFPVKEGDINELSNEVVIK